MVFNPFSSEKLKTPPPRLAHLRGAELEVLEAVGTHPKLPSFKVANDVPTEVIQNYIWAGP
jgi:hypothetical protein